MIKHIGEGLVPFDDCGFARYPAQPVAGETVRVQCRVDGSGEEPALTLCMGGKTERLSPNAVGQSLYAFELGKMERPCEVRYRFETQEEQTPWYAFDVCTRKTYEKPKALWQTPGGLCWAFAEDFYVVAEAGESLILRTQTKPVQGHVYEKAELSLPLGFSLEAETSAAFWKLKRLSETVAEGKGFCVTRNSKGDIVHVEAEANINCHFILGTGERFDAVNQMGCSATGRVVEKYTHQESQTYLPIPFWMTERGLGWYRVSDAPAAMQWRETYRVSQAAQGETLTVDELFFGTPKAVLRQFVARTGRPVLPPDWAFGLWISANGWNCDQEVDEQLAALKQYDYPADVMVLEAWSDERTFYRWNEDGSWADPAQTVRRIREAGLHLVLWQIPVLKHEWQGEPGRALSEDIEEAIAKGYLVRSGDGSPYRITENWFHHSLLIDFTNPEACRWWFGKRKYLLEMGVEGFKTDGGEFLFENAAQLHDGSTGLIAHNRYPAQYAQAYHDFMQEEGVAGVTFSRAGYVGAQKHPIHWAGDQTSEWSELAAQLVAGISAGLSGVLFWSFDIGGFAGNLPSAELYLRATAMGCFCPVMQWHAEPRTGQFYNSYPAGFQNDRSPWNLAEKLGDERVLTVGVRFAKLRRQLRPYLLEEAKHCAQTGRPMMAHLCLDDPEDERAWRTEDEYMLGRRYLVAPITREGENSRKVYLPKGSWRQFFTGEQRQGPCEFEEICPLDRACIWERSGADGGSED